MSQDNMYLHVGQAWGACAFATPIQSSGMHGMHILRTALHTQAWAAGVGWRGRCALPGPYDAVDLRGPGGKVIANMGLEPMTLRLLGARSNQLS
jgi:hypothetical protein